MKLAYSIKEAVAASPFSRSALYEDIKAGRLKTRKRGKSTFIMAGDFNDYLAGFPLKEK